MKTFTIGEAQNQLSRIIGEVNRGEVIVLEDGDQRVTLYPGGMLNPEEDSPELERELLKGIHSPVRPYSSQEIREVVERAIREKSHQ